MKSGNITKLCMQYNIIIVFSSDTDLTYCQNTDAVTISVDPKLKENTEKEKPRRELIFKEPTVRGKARQELEGWDCSKCKEVLIFINNLILF